MTTQTIQARVTEYAAAQGTTTAKVYAKFDATPPRLDASNPGDANQAALHAKFDRFVVRVDVEHAAAAHHGQLTGDLTPALYCLFYTKGNAGRFRAALAALGYAPAPAVHTDQGTFVVAVPRK